jgi:hypothetical protein
MWSKEGLKCTIDRDASTPQHSGGWARESAQVATGVGQITRALRLHRSFRHTRDGGLAFLIFDADFQYCCMMPCCSRSCRTEKVLLLFYYCFLVTVHISLQGECFSHNKKKKDEEKPPTPRNSNGHTAQATRR